MNCNNQLEFRVDLTIHGLFVSRENPRDLADRVASPFRFRPTQSDLTIASLAFLEYGFVFQTFARNKTLTIRLLLQPEPLQLLEPHRLPEQLPPRLPELPQHSESPPPQEPLQLQQPESQPWLRPPE